MPDERRVADVFEILFGVCVEDMENGAEGFIAVDVLLFRPIEQMAILFVLLVEVVLEASLHPALGHLQFEKID